MDLAKSGLPATTQVRQNCTTQKEATGSRRQELALAYSAGTSRSGVDKQATACCYYL